MANIHPTAEVHPESRVADNVEIGPFCIVGPRVSIGSGTTLKSHVIVDGDTTIGENNTIHPFAVLGNVPQDLKYNGEPTKLVIGNNNTIRESVTINLGTSQDRGETRIGNNNLLMAYVHLGHDCLINNHCVLSNAVGLAGHVTLDDYVILSGQTGVSQFVNIGAHAYIGGQSGVEKDVPPFTIALGSRPCVIKGANIVGMRRRGFAVDTIQKINEAIKLWSRSDVTKEQCLLDIDSQYGDLAEIKSLLEFIKNSRSGVIR